MLGMSVDLKPISKKLSQFIRLLASDHPGEIAAPAAAMKRTLASQKLDLNDFADHVEAAKRFTDEEARACDQSHGAGQAKGSRRNAGDVLHRKE